MAEETKEFEYLFSLGAINFIPSIILIEEVLYMDT